MRADFSRSKSLINHPKHQRLRQDPFLWKPSLSQPLAFQPDLTKSQSWNVKTLDSCSSCPKSINQLYNLRPVSPLLQRCPHPLNEGCCGFVFFFGLENPLTEAELLKGPGQGEIRGWCQNVNLLSPGEYFYEKEKTIRSPQQCAWSWSWLTLSHPVSDGVR